MLFGDDLVANGETHACALSHGLCCKKGIEDIGLDVGGNADAVVLDLNTDVMALGLG